MSETISDSNKDLVKTNIDESQAEENYKKKEKLEKKANVKKNWDKICNDLDNEKEEEGVDDMFNKLYSQADDDTRRAMMKSMYESKGTTLSMNWKEVGSKFVKPYNENNEKDEF